MKIGLAGSQETTLFQLNVTLKEHKAIRAVAKSALERLATDRSKDHYESRVVLQPLANREFIPGYPRTIKGSLEQAIILAGELYGYQDKRWLKTGKRQEIAHTMGSQIIDEILPEIAPTDIPDFVDMLPFEQNTNPEDPTA